MSKQATDAEVMEYLWPTRRLAQRERTMNSPRITSVGIAAALLLFSALLFGQRAEAGAHHSSSAEIKHERNEIWVSHTFDHRATFPGAYAH